MSNLKKKKTAVFILPDIVDGKRDYLILSLSEEQLLAWKNGTDLDSLKFSSLYIKAANEDIDGLLVVLHDGIPNSVHEL